MISESNFWLRFITFLKIEKWLKTQASECGNNCVLETIGKSYEGRTLYAFRFGKDIKTGATLPRIFTESTLHAREWLAQASHIYIIDQVFNVQSAVRVKFSFIFRIFRSIRILSFRLLIGTRFFISLLLMCLFCVRGVACQ